MAAPVSPIEYATLPAIPTSPTLIIYQNKLWISLDGKWQHITVDKVDSRVAS